MIKHISLDVWGTLISPNPNYANARNKFLAKTFNTDEETVAESYTETKRIIENSTYVLDPFSCVGLLTSTLNKRVGKDEIERILWELTELFNIHNPLVNHNIRYALNMLRYEGYTISILSNTNFISGYTMLPFLSGRYGNVFDFSIFSDVVGMAKPDKRIFDMVCQKSGKRPNEILHIGDSVEFDGAALNIGMDVKLTNDLEHTADILKGLL